VLTLTDDPTPEPQKIIGAGLADFNKSPSGYSDSRDLRRPDV
jgi:hypothetical protein